MKIEEEPGPGNFQWMLEESRKLTALMSIPDETIPEIYQASSDWEFILKVDALLEAAVRVAVKCGFRDGHRMDEAKLEAFVDTLAMRGLTSLLALLDAAGCPAICDLVDVIRQLRNGFAHDITQVRQPLIEVIMARKDGSSLLRKVCHIENYNEATLVESYRKDPIFLRFCILSGTLTFLILAYHNGFEADETAFG